MAFNADGGLVLTVDSSGRVRIWDAGVGAPLTTLQGEKGAVGFPLSFGEGGKVAVGVALTYGPRAGFAPVSIASEAVVMWDAKTGSVIRTIQVHAGLLACPMAENPSYLSGIASGCAMPPPPPLALVIPPPGNVFAGNAALVGLAVSPDGRYVAYATVSGVDVINLAGKVVGRLTVDGQPTGLAFETADTRVVVMTKKAVYVWNPLGAGHALLARQAAPPIDAELSADGDRLITVDVGGALHVWSTATGSVAGSPLVPEASLKLGGAYAQSVPLRAALNADGSVVGAGTSTGHVFMWNVGSGSLIAARAVSTWAILLFRASQDGSRFVAVNWPQAGSGLNPSGAAVVLDSTSGALLSSYQSPAPKIAPIFPGAALNADGAFVLSGVLGLAPSPDGNEAILQVSTGQVMANLQSVTLSATAAYSLFPVSPWAPDGADVLAGDDAIYACDACGSLRYIQSAASARIAWWRPLSPGDDHPPVGDPFR